MKKNKTPITANIFKVLRCRYKYNQDVFAEWLGLDRTTYTKKELGQTNIYADELITILENLDQRGHKMDGMRGIIDILNPD